MACLYMQFCYEYETALNIHHIDLLLLFIFYFGNILNHGIFALYPSEVTWQLISVDRTVTSVSSAFCCFTSTENLFLVGRGGCCCLGKDTELLID